MTMWIAALVSGTANDAFFMALPMVDNFWQAQVIDICKISFAKKKLPRNPDCVGLHYANPSDAPLHSLCLRGLHVLGWNGCLEGWKVSWPIRYGHISSPGRNHGGDDLLPIRYHWGKVHLVNFKPKKFDREKLLKKIKAIFHFQVDMA